MPTDCFNCGPTDRALKGRNLCSKCYNADKIRNRFDPKPRPEVRKWTPKDLTVLRYFRFCLRLPLHKIAGHFHTNRTQVRMALKKYRLKETGEFPRKPHRPETSAAGSTSTGGSGNNTRPNSCLPTGT